MFVKSVLCCILGYIKTNLLKKYKAETNIYLCCKDFQQNTGEPNWSLGTARWLIYQTIKSY